MLNVFKLHNFLYTSYEILKNLFAWSRACAAGEAKTRPSVSGGTGSSAGSATSGARSSSKALKSRASRKSFKVKRKV